MAAFLFITLSLGLAYYVLAISDPLKRLVRFMPRDREEAAPLGPMPGMVPESVKELALRLKEHVLTERELREQLNSQRKLSSSVFDSLDSGLVLTGTNLGIIFANGAFREWFSPRVDCQERSILEFCLNHEIAQLKEEVVAGSALAEPRTLEMEVFLEGKRQARFFRVRATPAELEGSPPALGVLFVFEDVTRLRELETIRRDFVANASHELRTPLSIIKGYLENLQDGALDDRAMSMRFLGIMEKHCDKLTSIVKDLLTVSRLESYTFSLEPEPIDLEDCVRGIEEQLQPLIRANDVAVSLDISPNPFILSGDRFCFDQIFFNLMENSIKHNTGRNLCLTVTARAEGGTAVIEFRDNGIGIPRDDQPFVFNRFYRVTRGRANIAEGTGLGLSIVKHAMEAHGGEVTLASSPGAGVAITMRVPGAVSAEAALPVGA